MKVNREYAEFVHSFRDKTQADFKITMDLNPKKSHQFEVIPIVFTPLFFHNMIK